MNGRSTKSDLKRLDATKDQDIDYADILPLDDSFFDKQTVTIPPPKEQLTIRFDRDIIAWFREQGRGYQTRMNAVLRAYVDTQKRRTEQQARK